MLPAELRRLLGSPQRRQGAVIEQQPRGVLVAQVAGLLEQFELQDLAERNVKTLSDVQFRRGLSARAVVHEPKVLLLDEPCEGLAPGNLELVKRELDQTISRGTQLICATHVHRNTSQFNRAMVIEDGRITRSGEVTAG